MDPLAALTHDRAEQCSHSGNPSSGTILTSPKAGKLVAQCSQPKPKTNGRLGPRHTYSLLMLHWCGTDLPIMLVRRLGHVLLASLLLDQRRTMGSHLSRSTLRSPVLVQTKTSYPLGTGASVPSSHLHRTTPQPDFLPAVLAHILLPVFRPPTGTLSPDTPTPSPTEAPPHAAPRSKRLDILRKLRDTAKDALLGSHP